MPEQNEQQPNLTSEQPEEPVVSETPPSPELAEPPAPKIYTEADGVESWAVGKTDAEIMALTSNLMETMKTFDPSQQRVQRAPAPIQPAMEPLVAGPILPAADLAYSDPAAYNSQMQNYLNARDEKMKADLTQQFQTVMQPINATMGSMARQQIANDPTYKEVYDKWGHEVDQYFAQQGVVPNQRTPDAYRLVGDVIKGRHVTDLARAEADRILQAGGHAPTVRAGTGGQMLPSAPPGDAFDQAWEDSELSIIQAAKYNNVTKEDMRKSIKHTGHTVDEWVKLMSGDNVFIATDGRLTRTQTLPPAKRGNN